jgi:hypothetical protein
VPWNEFPERGQLNVAVKEKGTNQVDTTARVSKPFIANRGENQSPNCKDVKVQQMQTGSKVEMLVFIMQAGPADQKAGRRPPGGLDGGARAA